MLAGITEVKVVVEELNPAAMRLGITESGVQAYVELRLRQSGVAVASDSSSSGVFVYVRISVMPISGFDANVHMSELKLFQQVTLRREPRLGSNLAATWHQSAGLNVGPSDTTPYAIRRDLAELLDQFCNDLLAANAARRVLPRRESPRVRSGAR